MLEKIKWLGQSGFKIITAAGKTIYLDPYKVPAESPLADFIFITHGHFDHFSPEVIAKIRGEKTQIYCSAELASKIGGQLKTVKPGDKFAADGFGVQVVPAYNINKDFHPKENNWVGFILEIDGQRIYHAGDTDLIPEMKDLKNIDIALLPVGGTYTMNWQEAAEAVKAFAPKMVIPMHYGEAAGSDDDAINFKQAVGEKVVILEKEG
ncbi:MAG: MBL fold metallo-hydrolase [Patescibacteria group bacterium]